MDASRQFCNLHDVDVVFLGAGFSRAISDGRSPLMNDFFAGLDRREYWLLSLFLEETFEDPLTANVEEAILKLDQICLSPITGKDAFIDQCRVRQSDVRRELDRYILNRLGQIEMDDMNWVVHWLMSCSNTTTVITTNYDNLAESVLSARRGVRHWVSRPWHANVNCHHCRMRRILADECSPCDTPSDTGVELWKGALLKLHGSVAWKMCETSSCTSRLCLVPDVHCQVFKCERCGCCGNECSPVLVHPSMAKKFERFRGLTQMWNGAYDALSSARNVVFFGFSFPKSDVAINEMIRYTMGRSHEPMHIGIIDVAPRWPADRIAEMCVKRPTPAIVTELEVPHDGSVPEWVAAVKPTVSGR